MTDPVSVTPLRQRMIEDMTIRRFGEYTQRDYMRQVREFTAFLGLPPDRAEPEDLRRYQLHLASLGASYARMNLACTALRFPEKKSAPQAKSTCQPTSLDAMSLLMHTLMDAQNDSPG